jgi:hypothetical protein
LINDANFNVVLWTLKIIGVMSKVITIVTFSSILGLFILFMFCDNRNIQSRTEREYKMLLEEKEKNKQEMNEYFRDKNNKI